MILAINSLHNLQKPELLTALKEMKRLARKGTFLQVDSFRTPEEKELFESWVLTAYTYGYPHEWEAIFAEAGYAGDYYWTFITGE